MHPRFFCAWGPADCALCISKGNPLGKICVHSVFFLHYKPLGRGMRILSWYQCLSYNSTKKIIQFFNWPFNFHLCHFTFLAREGSYWAFHFSFHSSQYISFGVQSLSFTSSVPLFHLFPTCLLTLLSISSPLPYRFFQAYGCLFYIFSQFRKQHILKLILWGYLRYHTLIMETQMEHER